MSNTPSNISKAASPQNAGKLLKLHSQQSDENIQLLEDFESYYKSLQGEKNKENPSLQKFSERVLKQRVKLKLDSVTKEKRFNGMLEAHKSQKTFVDITKFLRDINMLNCKSLVTETRNVRERLEELEKLKMMEGFVNEHIEVKHAGVYGYFQHLQNIRDKIHLQEKKQNIRIHEFQSQQKLNELRNLNKQIDFCLEEKARSIPVDLNFNDIDQNNDYFNEEIKRMKVPDKNEDDVFQVPIRKTFQRSFKNVEQEKRDVEDEQLRYKFQKLEKMKTKVLTTIDENIDFNNADLANIFQKKAEKVINHMEKLQMTEKQQHDVIRENMQQFSRKVAKPKKLLQVLKMINVKRQLKQSEIGKSNESITTQQEITIGKRTQTLSTIKVHFEK